VVVATVDPGEVHGTDTCRSEKPLPANRCSPRRGGTALVADSETTAPAATLATP
jgi:hypothetical protein